MVTFPILAFLLLAAHFSRVNLNGLALACLLLPFLLFHRKRWVVITEGILLLTGSVIWGITGYRLALMRIHFGMPYHRLIAIMGGVALYTIFSAWVLLRQKSRNRYPGDPGSAAVSTWVFSLTFLTLSMIQLKVPLNMLLLNRFIPGFGWLEILLLAVYGAVVAARIYDHKTQARWRIRVWHLFTIVFFGQLILGLLGFDSFLMTGKLHLPVPALIAAGPIYRGHEFFMIFLFLGTIVLVGPAWCSQLCYIGAWDDAASRSKKIPGYYRNDRVRIIIAVLVIGAAILLRILKVGWLPATILAAAFGLAGVGIMLRFSRKKGVMVHCTAYCPIGLFANILGKLNPFRIRIDTGGCTSCMACAQVCRYSALTLKDIQAGKPSLTCTLCGDCISDCPQNTIHYHFPGMKAETARKLFIVLVVTLHAVFLGVARI
ncbi:MAG: 4Fe-4S binding protein [Acidobacteria bacterium]|nr:4Fe-4S binding protein [Acidobacteriota bacterium]